MTDRDRQAGIFVTFLNKKKLHKEFPTIFRKTVEDGLNPPMLINRIWSKTNLVLLINSAFWHAFQLRHLWRFESGHYYVAIQKLCGFSENDRAVMLAIRCLSIGSVGLEGSQGGICRGGGGTAGHVPVRRNTRVLSTGTKICICTPHFIEIGWFPAEM